MIHDDATRRLLQASALLLIGHGLIGLLKPRWHPLIWAGGPKLLRAASEELADRPGLARWVYGAEVAVGVAVAAQTRGEDE